MEKPDTLIIGAGIAGCGLAYNLKRAGYVGSILVLDKKGVGKKKDYQHRTTFREVVEEYGLPHGKIFPSLKFGTSKEIFFNLKADWYSINYNDACRHLLEGSGAELRREEATDMDLKKNVLATNLDRYRPRYVIDCTGMDSFLSQKIHGRRPHNYWLGKTVILKKRVNLNSIYFILNSDGTFEDLYPHETHTCYGKWRYTSVKDLNYREPRKNDHFSDLIASAKIAEEHDVIVAGSPVFPIVHKNCAFLGDSFGNATTIASEGVRPILNSSKMLVAAMLQGNLKLYEKQWRSEYLRIYLWHMASKNLSGRNFNENRGKVLRAYKGHDDLFYKVLLSDKNLRIPGEIQKKIPLELKLRQMLKFTELRLKYSFI